MKYFFLVLFVVSQLVAKSSIFPLKYSIDDSGLFALQSTIFTTKGKEFTSKSISLTNSDDLYVILGNNLLSHPLCKNSFFDLKEYKNDNFNVGNKYCKKLFNNIYKHVVGKIKKGNFKIIISQEKNLQIYHCVIFKNNQFAGAITSNLPLDKFKKLLYTIQNSKIEKIDTYIKNANKYLYEGKINSALKNYISAAFLDHKNSKLHELDKKIKAFRQKLLNQKIIFFTDKIWLH